MCPRSQVHFQGLFRLDGLRFALKSSHREMHWNLNTVVPNPLSRVTKSTLILQDIRLFHGRAKSSRAPHQYRQGRGMGLMTGSRASTAGIAPEWYEKEQPLDSR